MKLFILQVQIWAAEWRIWRLRRRMAVMRTQFIQPAWMGPVEFCRRRGAVTARFTGGELREIAEDLTGCLVRLLRDAKGRGELLPTRRNWAAVCRRVRNINGRFAEGA